MRAAIKAIEYYLPKAVTTNEDLIRDFPEWTPEKIASKTGISKRHISDEQECSSDLAVGAARKLFERQVCQPKDIDFIMLCTQSPDYFLPTTACLIQDRLGIPAKAGALDFNLGCSGFVYGLGLAKGLIETDQAQKVLLLTAETYSKFLNPKDKSSRVIFGDAAAATLVEARLGDEKQYIGPFVWGTDGSGANNLIVESGGMRYPISNHRNTSNWLHMNGPEIFTFTLRVVPNTVSALLSKAGLSLQDIDLFVFHQANKYMLDHLRNKLSIPKEKFFINLENYGNTVSSTVPIALRDAQQTNMLKPGDLVMLLGFGVGYSWAGTIIQWCGE